MKYAKCILYHLRSEPLCGLPGRDSDGVVQRGGVAGCDMVGGYPQAIKSESQEVKIQALAKCSMFLGHDEDKSKLR